MLRFISYLRQHYWVTVVVAATLPGTSAAGIEFVATGGVQGPWPIGAAIAGGIFTALVLKIVRPSNAIQPSPTIEEANLTNATKGAPSNTEGRFFSPRSLDELVDDVRGQTSIVAREVSKRHIGHWLRIRGSITDVSDYEDWIWVHISSSSSDVTLTLEFNKNLWREKLVAYNGGDEISAIGKIESIENGYRGHINLEDCELLP